MHGGFLCIMPRVNRCNIAGQQPTTLLDVTCCVRLHAMLLVVACCCVLFRKVWNGSKFWANNSQDFFFLWSPKRSATMLDPFAQLLQHCWSHARALHMVSKVLWVVSFPRCTAGPNSVWSCLHTTHQHCHNNSQYCRANNIGSSLLHSRF